MISRRERYARAIWAVRPDCFGKPWPLETAEARRRYPHFPIAAVDLCFIYADAILRSDNDLFDSYKDFNPRMGVT